MEFKQLKQIMWRIIIRENIIVTNQNIDWLLERAFNEANSETK